MASGEASRPRLAFIGSLSPPGSGRLPGQSETLASLFAAAGYEVRTASTARSRAARLVDITRALLAGRRSIDVVVLSVFSGRAFALADWTSALARHLALPQIHVLRGGALPELARRRRLWVRRVLGRAAIRVAPSGFLAAALADLALEIAIVPNVLDLDRYAFRQRSTLAPRLLWMRSFEPAYNPTLAIETLARLRDRHPAATLTMAGPQRGMHLEIERLAAERGLASAVAFPGMLSGAAKHDCFAAHDVMLNTNRVDNTPVTMLEAAAAGLAIVATAVGGIPYLLADEQTALLVNDGDAAGMAVAVDRLLTEHGLAAKLTANARRIAEASAWAVLQPRWEMLFAQALADARRAGNAAAATR
jgi:L-malate glycosyltransferase